MTPVRAAVRRIAPIAPEPTTRPTTRPNGDHLHVVAPVRESARRRRRLSRRGTAATALVFIGLLALAATHTVLVQGQITLDSLDEAVAEQQADYQRARLEVARLEAPDRIVDEAITRLGMVEPVDVVYLTPERGDTFEDEPRGRDDSDQTWLAIKPYLERNP